MPRPFLRNFGTWFTLTVLAIGLALKVTVVVYSSKPITRTVQPAVVMDVLDPTLNPFGPMWHDEIARRFPTNVVGVLCHGGELVDGEWVVLDNPVSATLDRVTDLVKHEQAKFPGRTIVLLCCNPGHIKLGIPGVYYAESSVWCVPDRSLNTAEISFATEQINWFSHKSAVPMITFVNRWAENPEIVGNIYEFVSE